MPNNGNHTVKALKRKLKDLVTQTEAARIIGIARQSVAGLHAREMLNGEVVAGTLYVTRESAERERDRRAADVQDRAA